MVSSVGSCSFAHWWTEKHQKALLMFSMKHSKDGSVAKPGTRGLSLPSKPPPSCSFSGRDKLCHLSTLCKCKPIPARLQRLVRCSTRCNANYYSARYSHNCKDLRVQYQRLESIHEHEELRCNKAYTCICILRPVSDSCCSTVVSSLTSAMGPRSARQGSRLGTTASSLTS